MRRSRRARYLVLAAVVAALGACQDLTQEFLTCEAVDDAAVALIEDADFEEYVLLTGTVIERAEEGNDQAVLDLSRSVRILALQWEATEFSDDVIESLNLSGMDLLQDRCGEIRR